MRFFFPDSQDQVDPSYDFERETLTLAASGRWNENEWQKPEGREEMLLRFKGVMESLVRSLGREHEIAESKEAVIFVTFNYDTLVEAAYRAVKGL